MKGINSKSILLILIAYTGLLIYWMIFGFGRIKQVDFKYNIIPLVTIINYFKNIRYIQARIWIVNLGGNIGVFIPFGLILPLYFKGNFIKSYSIFLIGIFILETIQLISKRGSFDIDDIILNSLGFLLGYLIFVIIKNKIQNSKK